MRKSIEAADNYLAQIPKTGAIHRTGIFGLPGKFVRDRLDRMAKTRGQVDRFDLFLPRAANLCGHSFGASYTVVELGPGDGWALRCSSPGLKKIAIDVGSHFAPDFARDGIEFHQCDISRETLPISDCSIDLIILSHVIEHISDPTHLMTECARVLRKGGGLYFRTPDITRLKFRFWEDWTHVRPYSQASLCRMATAFGFTCRHIWAANHARISLDLLTNGQFRNLLMRGGWEIEAAFSLR